MPRCLRWRHHSLLVCAPAAKRAVATDAGWNKGVVVVCNEGVVVVVCGLSRTDRTRQTPHPETLNRQTPNPEILQWFLAHEKTHPPMTTP